MPIEYLVRLEQEEPVLEQHTHDLAVLVLGELSAQSFLQRHMLFNTGACVIYIHGCIIHKYMYICMHNLFLYK